MVSGTLRFAKKAYIYCEIMGAAREAPATSRITFILITRMRHFSTLVNTLCLLCLLSACSGNTHFLTDPAYRDRVAADYQLKKTLLPNGDLFSTVESDLCTYEQEAMQFLYAYMPLGDITDYSGDFYLMNIRASRRVAQEMPWGKKIPEDVFRHFVLPVRVNNESLDSARVVFYKELQPRVEHLSMYDAILEVNHWCHEKAVYQPSDARTSSPMVTVRTAYGRCGEESTFLVAALRSVGIPARQVYTPRWAHTDDNHAWVEAWADGQWYFLGACEPEPVLNLGWFNAPASRGMLMHTKVFGRYEGTEEVMSVTPNYTEINVTANYAPTAEARVKVCDETGQPVPGATVEFKIYNYAEFYTVSTKRTGADGLCRLTAGKGDMLAWASKDGRFGFAKVSFGKQEEATVILDKQDGDLFDMDIDIMPPAEQANLPETTLAQQEENKRRLAQEDSIREAYIATMMDDEEARAWIDGNLKKENLTADLRDRMAYMLVASRGNHETLKAFLADYGNKEAELRNPLEKAVILLESLSAKDLRDVCRSVLDDNMRYTPQHAEATMDEEATLTSALLCPRVANEKLTPYKQYLQNAVSKEDKEAFQNDPHKLAEWCKANIRLADSLNSQSIPMSPQGVWKARVADRRSRDIFFVAMARSLGIPAWIDAVTKQVRYSKLPQGNAPATVYNVDLDEAAAPTIPNMGHVQAHFAPTRVFDNPKYYSHFSLSRCEGGKLSLQSYDETNSTWQSLLSAPRKIPAGYYVMVNGTRLANGGVLAHIASFTVEKGKLTKTRLSMRESQNEVQVIGNFNSESLFTPIEAGEPAPATSLLSACGRGYYVVGILGVGQEPTNHALKDIAKIGSDLEEWGRKLVLLFPDEEQYRKHKHADFPGMPSTVIYGIDTDGIAAQIATEMKLGARAPLPLFIIADTFNRVVFVSKGYTIGLGEQLLHTVKGL